MADNQTTLALNIGSQRISMAVFETSRSGGLVLKNYQTESIVADPALDSSRNAQCRILLADMVNRLGVAKLKARYAISGQAVFTRFVKLPPIQQDNLEQLVTFEAQQHVPFPLDEVVWDYELIEGSVEKEAVIVAIKSDALDEINSAVNDAGMGTCEVDVAPMALYNAYRANYGEVTEPVLLIDIGAKTSNLIYIEGQRFFTRSVAIGGVSVTSAIAKEYNVSFAEAEKQKVVNGMVALGGGHTGMMDEAVAALAMVIRNALGRLPAEIARTTNYYRSQHGGSAPRRVLLAGGGANLPYTLEFFREKLNLPIEYFNPVGNLILAKDVDPAVIRRDGHLMGELIGLGLRGMGKSKINIDLVPTTVEQLRASDKRKPFLIAAAAVLIGGMGVWAAFQEIAAVKAEDMARTMKEQRDSLAPICAQIKTLTKKEEGLRVVADAYVEIQSDHAFWMDLIGELRSAFASDVVWLTDLEPLTHFDAAMVMDPAYDPQKTINGQLVVKDDFYKIEYGKSALADIKPPKPKEDPKNKPKGKKPNKKDLAVVADSPRIDAVRIRGYWRNNPRGQNIVSDLLKHLEDKSSSFQFTVPDPNDPKKTINLADNQYIGKIMKVTSVPLSPEDIAQPFEITLPVARKVAIK